MTNKVPDVHGRTRVLCHFIVSRLSKVLLQVCFIGAMIASLHTAAMAQTTSKPTDGSTPLGLQAGAPAGSYSLSGFDNVNLYNGSLNFGLPLLSIGGRGGASHTIMLPIERHWMIEKTQLGEDIWQSYIDGREEEIKPGYGPGVMAARYSSMGIVHACPTPTPPNGEDDSGARYDGTLTRLSFTGPDGSEIEFRDIGTGGVKQGTGNYCINNPGYNRGKVFQSVDGSGATFISSVDIHDMVLVGSTPEAYGVGGYMFLRDGTVYGISNGLVYWIRDRNGNKISFAYDDYSRVTTITDSLNRQVTIVYDYNEGGSYGTCDKITYKGFNGTYGTTRVIRISKTSLGNVLRSGYSLTNWGYGPNYNPTVVSSVWLPDADGVTRRYQFQYNTYAELARVVLPTGGAYEYDIGGGTTDTASSFGVVGNFPSEGVYRRVHERRVYADGTNLTSRTTYSLPETQDAYLTMSTVGYVTVQQYDASSNLLAASKHYFSGSGAGLSLLGGGGTGLGSQTDGREYQTDVLDTNGTTVLRRSVSTWAGGSSIGPNTTAVVNARVTQVVSTIEPSGANLVSKQTFSYDQYNNQTDIYEYAFGTGSAGSLMRHTVTSYVTTNNSYDYACDPSSTCSASAVSAT